jgi:ubiquinone/menaquinone biosynthesis C-methylase UbiE
VRKASSLVQQKFGAAAADYAASSVHAKGETLARLVTLTKPEKHWRVLDVATGAGHTAHAFAPHVAKVVASDITEPMLAEARKLARAKGLANVSTAPAAAEDLPFPDGSFHLVTCRLAAHHFTDVAAFAREAYRVLLPGGVIAIVDNISPDDSAIASAYNAFEKLRDPSHARCLALGEWTELLTKVGFSVTHTEQLDQEIEFAPWVERMRCSDNTVARLRQLLGEPPLRDLLRPRQPSNGFVFTLQEGIVLAEKPR